LNVAEIIYMTIIKNKVMNKDFLKYILLFFSAVDTLIRSMTIVNSRYTKKTRKANKNPREAATPTIPKNSVKNAVNPNLAKNIMISRKINCIQFLLPAFKNSKKWKSFPLTIAYK